VILFLDYDGVLHPDGVYLEHGRPVLRVEGKLFMWAGLLVDVLTSHPSVRIVLSTSWVRELRYSCARDYLPVVLRSRVIGATWHSAMAFDDELRPQEHETWWDQATRYQQIRRYVDRAGLTDWIAMDDQPVGWDEADLGHLIRTNGERGLSDPDVLSRLTDLLKDTP
jgi:hypothetical protein